MANPENGYGELTRPAAANESEVTEVRIVRSETWGQSEAEQRFACLYTPSEEVITTQRAALWGIIDCALATAGTQHERDALLATGRVFDWQLFTPTDPPPPDLVLTATDTDEGYLTYDTRRIYNYECAHAAGKRLQMLGLDAVTEAVRLDIASRSGQIAGALNAIVAELPEKVFIDSFDMRLPAGVSEQPLPPNVRDAREQQIQHQGRVEFAMADHEPIQANRNARQHIRRGLQMLDDETMRLPAESSDDDAFKRARDFFFPRLAAVAQRQYGVTLTGFSKSTTDLVMEGSHIPPDLVDRSANSIINEVVEEMRLPSSGSGRPLSLGILRQILLSNFVETLFDPHYNGTYQEMVLQLVDDITTETMRTLLVSTGVNCYDPDDEVLSQLRHMPVAEYVDVAELHSVERATHPRCNFYAAMRPAGFRTRAEYERSNIVIGQLSPESRDSISGRVIVAQPLTKDVPTFTPGEDLVLVMYGTDYRGSAEPYVPGYKIVSRSGSRYGFVRDDHDPYTPILTPFDDALRAKAEAIARRIGMYDLGDAIATCPGMTVETLRQLLEAHADYVLPESIDEFWAYAYIQSIDDYAVYVRDGRMIQQCTLSSDFLRQYLDELFGAGSASMITGHTVGPNGLITAVTHRQASFVTPDGTFHILDAQPPFTDSARPSIILPTPVALVAPRQHTLAEMSPPRPTFMEMPDEETLRSQRLSLVHDQLEAYLMVIFRAPDIETLRERVAALPEADPVRRTVEIVRLALYDTTQADDVHAALAYVRKIAGADGALVKRIGLEVYEPRILTILEESIYRLQVALAGSVSQPDASSVGAAAERVPETADAASIEAVEQRLQAALERLSEGDVVFVREAIHQALNILYETFEGSNPASIETIVIELENTDAAARNALAHIREGIRLISEYRRTNI